jgi:DNA-binding response OmpR family regulator
MPILLIEDDTMIGRAVRSGQVDAGFAVDWFTEG